MKQHYFKYVIYSLLFLSFLTPIITTSLPMKALDLSSEVTRTGISDDKRVAASTDNTWTNKTTITGDKPSARSDFSMAYDSAHDRVILFGGWDEGGNYVDDTWVYCFAGIPSGTLLPAGDDDDDDEEPAIPGYDIYLVLGLIFTCGLITIIVIKKKIIS